MFAIVESHRFSIKIVSFVALKDFSYPQNLILFLGRTIVSLIIDIFERSESILYSEDVFRCLRVVTIRSAVILESDIAKISDNIVKKQRVMVNFGVRGSEDSEDYGVLAIF